MAKTFIDPPSGWKWGFPKEVPDPLPDGMSTEEWMVSVGYPQEELDYWNNSKIGCVPARMWTENEDSEVPEPDVPSIEEPHPNPDILPEAAAGDLYGLREHIREARERLRTMRYYVDQLEDVADAIRHLDTSRALLLNVIHKFKE